ncbi:MAG TPA: alpha/beta hydrolase domain-containing protein [Acetobacteraceae bacterium]
MRRIVMAALLSVAATAAQARVTSVRIDRVEPFAAGAAFGDTGPYERVIGVAAGTLDPKDPANAGITGLDRAPRNAAGLVEYETDLFLLRPADPARGNHRLLFEVTNRGNKYLLHSFELVPIGAGGIRNDPSTAADAGTGLLFRMGYTMAWSGWDPDVPRANNTMSIRIPRLAGVTAEIRDEFVSGTRGPAADRFRLSYEAATPFQGRFTLRRRAADPAAMLPPESWRVSDSRSLELLPAGTKFEPGSIYELTYRATDPWVSGIGFAATRDVAAFLRGPESPSRGVTHAIAFGSSQSGRFLRDFLDQGFNRGESGARVFDGVFSHIAGIGKLFLNTLFAEPPRTRTQHEDQAMPENWHPFATARTRDPVTGREAAILRGDGRDPLLIETNTSSEYWQKGASLLSTDPEGMRDLALPDTTRLYFIAGTQHGGRAGVTDARGSCVNPRNWHDPGPALRALLVAMDAWVANGAAPPPSRIPSLRAGTLKPAELVGLPALPGLVRPLTANRIVAHNGPDGDWVHPEPDATPYRALVPAVNGDGNETSGIRLPDLAVPVATLTGWNLYAEPYPTGEMCDRDGSSLAFPLNAAARQATRDPRPSLVERYGDNAAFVAKVEAAARALVAERLLLEEDVPRYVAWARTVKFE